MIAFITALGLDEIDLLGFSIGGFIAQEIALLRPRSREAADPGGNRS